MLTSVSSFMDKKEREDVNLCMGLYCVYLEDKGHLMLPNSNPFLRICTYRREGRLGVWT